MKNFIKLCTLFVILILNSGFYGLNFFQKKSSAPVPFKVVRTLTDGSDPTFIWGGATASSTNAYFNVNFSDVMWETDGTLAGTQSLTSWISVLPADSRFVGESKGLVYYYSDFNGELWRSDNTVAGTYAVSAAAAFGNIQNIYTIHVGGQDYTVGFGANGAYQSIIYQTDGTLAGTFQNIIPFDLGFAEWGMTAAGMTILFTNQTTGDMDLHIYDVTTHTLGAAYTSISGFLYYGFLRDVPKNLDKFYFSLHIWGGCDEMFVTDGTALGTYNLSTVQYCNIMYGGQMSDGSQIFVNSPGFRKWGFYKTNGTSTSDWTLLVETSLDSTVTGYNWGIDFIENINDKVVVRFYNNLHSDVASNCPIWVSDGTVAGTTQLSNTLAIHAPTAPVLGRSDFKPLVFNNNVFFQGYTGGTGTGLWKTNGIAAPSAVITGIEFTSEEYNWKYSAKATPSYFAFNATTSTNGLELYRSDGTPGGTFLLKDINPGASSGIESGELWGTALGNNIVFAADNTTNGKELWITDGTSVGTVPLAFLNPNPGGAFISDFQLIGSNFYFTARDDSHGVEPWVSDGTTTGTHILKDVSPGLESTMGIHFADTSTGVIFTAANATGYDSALWKTDGTTAGTTKFYNDSVYSQLVSANGYAYFSGYDATNGQQLWKTDGTFANTALVKAVGGGSIFDYDIWSIFPFNNSIIYAPVRRIPGNPWISDGTAAGTKELISIVSGVWDNSMPYGGIAIGTSVSIFAANDASYHVSLYATDGTPAGTSQIKDINTTGEPNIGFFTEINGKVVFKADDGVNGSELWITDGTTLGTQMIKDISSGAASTEFETVAFASDGSNIYFFAKPDGQEWQLWKTDGTPGGTSAVYTFSSGSGPYSTKMITAGSYLFFTACTAANGCELWRSDKTGAGTRLYWDLTLGPNSTNPESLIYHNNLVFFVGTYLTSTTAIWATGVNTH